MVTKGRSVRSRSGKPRRLRGTGRGVGHLGREVGGHAELGLDVADPLAQGLGGNSGGGLVNAYDPSARHAVTLTVG